MHNELKGAIIRSVTGQKLSIGGDKIHALAINRPLLDANLALEAEEAGAQLLTGTKASHFERQDGTLRIHLQGQDSGWLVETRLLIGADGARSNVARWAKLQGPNEVIRAINARTRLPEGTPDFVEVFLGQSLAPGWFAWIIPLGNGEARLGIGTRQGSPARRLKEFMAAFPRRFRGAEILNLSGGLIPLGLPQQIYADNTMLVGDAACQVKPTSGGGVYTGLRAARSCARTAVHALQRDDLSAESLRRYQATWLEQMGDELKLGILLRRIFAILSDDDFDRLLHLASNQSIQRIISRYGDIDHPSSVIAQLITAFPGLKTLSSLGIGVANMGMNSVDKWVKDVAAILRRPE